MSRRKRPGLAPFHRLAAWRYSVTFDANAGGGFDGTHYFQTQRDAREFCERAHNRGITGHGPVMDLHQSAAPSRKSEG